MVAAGVSAVAAGVVAASDVDVSVVAAGVVASVVDVSVSADDVFCVVWSDSVVAWAVTPASAAIAFSPADGTNWRTKVNATKHASTFLALLSPICLLLVDFMSFPFTLASAKRARRMPHPLIQDNFAFFGGLFSSICTGNAIRSRTTLFGEQATSSSTVQPSSTASLRA